MKVCAAHSTACRDLNGKANNLRNSLAGNSHIKWNIPILAICQALFMSGTSLVVSTTALVGLELADDKTYASLPFALQLLTTMLTSIPAAMLMSRIGRKASFLLATVIAVLGGLICTLAIIRHEFFLFLSGSMLLGIFAGFANYYRFTAADIVDKAFKSRAISYVLAGGVLAAVIGPNLANITRDTIRDAHFAGSYASTIVLYVLSFILLLLLKLPQHTSSVTSGSHTTGRPLTSIARQPGFIIAVICGMLGYATMSLVMTATPLAMQQHDHPFSDTSFVIQWHVLAMFVPSFFTGQLIYRFGLFRIMLIGAGFGLGCVFINLNGTDTLHFWIALVMLGLCWNFLFIGATTLLTETYQTEERFKAQALNDFLVFSMVASASLTAGILQHKLGWQSVNLSALPAMVIVILSLLWLYKLTHSKAAVSDTPDREILEDAINQTE